MFEKNKVELKQSLRSHFKAVRGAIPHELKHDYEVSIANELIGSIFWKETPIIFLYSSFGSEVSTKFLIEKALQENKIVLLPRIDTRLNVIRPIQIHSDTQYSSNTLGFTEPIGDEFIIDNGGSDIVCILPLLAFDSRGFRLGYGGGYYDKFLAKYPLITICGIAFSVQHSVDSLPNEDHDMPMQWIITENGIQNM